MHDEILKVAYPNSFRYGPLHLTEISAKLKKSFLTSYFWIIHCPAKIDSIVRIFLDIIHLS